MENLTILEKSLAAGELSANALNEIKEDRRERSIGIIIGARDPLVATRDAIGKGKKTRTGRDDETEAASGTDIPITDRIGMTLRTRMDTDTQALSACAGWEEDDARRRHHREHRSRDREDERESSGLMRLRAGRRKRRNFRYDTTRYLRKDQPNASGLVRDSWMTAPSALDVDYVQRPSRKKDASADQGRTRPHSPQERAEHRIGRAGERRTAPTWSQPSTREVNYKFGDEGSSWRMTKLKAVYTTAEQSGRPVMMELLSTDSALSRSLTMREEKVEMDRRKVYG